VLEFVDFEHCFQVVSASSAGNSESNMSEWIKMLERAAIGLNMEYFSRGSGGLVAAWRKYMAQSMESASYFGVERSRMAIKAVWDFSKSLVIQAILDIDDGPNDMPIGAAL